MTPATAAPESPDAQTTAAFLAQRLQGYQGNLPWVSAVVLAVAGLLAGLMQGRVPADALALWFGGVLLTQLLRVAVGLQQRRQPAAARNDPRWLWRHRLCLLAQGLAWAACCLLPMAPGDPLSEALRALVVVGLLGGAFALLAFDLVGALSLAVPVSAMLVVQLARLDGPVWLLLAWALPGMVLLLALATHRAGQTAWQLVALRERSDRQAATLRCSEARLAEKSATLEVAVESISQGIAHIDAQGRVRVFSRRARELLNLPAEACAEGADYDSVRSLQIARGDLPGRAYVDEHGQTHALPADWRSTPARYVRRTPGGGLLEVRSRVLPDGGMVRTYTDVTEDLQARQALAAATAEAERANQAKSRFLSGMSHELRTPLNAIMGFAEVLSADHAEPLTAAQRRQVAAIGDGAHHLLHLINDLLDLALVESGRLKVALAPVPLAPLLDTALTMAGPLARSAGVALPAAAPLTPDLAGASVQADRTRLLQVLLNLLSNAVKHNRAGGSARLLCAPLADSAGWVRLEVCDDGPGLSAADCERLFEPFERLGQGHSAADGVGLGLALSRALVQAMQGRIGLHSTPGQGSRFWVDLPLATATDAAAAPATAPADAPVDDVGALLGPHDTVLYIEDNPVNALLMEAMLARLGGPRLVVADRAETGLQQARALRPRLVLLDIELPDLHGHEVLRRLQADPACRPIPVLAVSANAMPEDIRLALQAGCSHYLTKPLSLAPLREAVRAALKWSPPPPPP